MMNLMHCTKDSQSSGAKGGRGERIRNVTWHEVDVKRHAHTLHTLVQQEICFKIECLEVEGECEK